MEASMGNENEHDGDTGGGEQGSTTLGQHGDGESTAAATGHEAVAAESETHQVESSSGSPGASSPRPKQRRGFAAMDPNKQKEIASKGGKASHALGTGHEWNSDAARAAGRKGGQASRGGRGKLPDGSSGSEGGQPT